MGICLCMCMYLCIRTHSVSVQASLLDSVLCLGARSIHTCIHTNNYYITSVLGTDRQTQTHHTPYRDAFPNVGAHEIRRWIQRLWRPPWEGNVIVKTRHAQQDSPAQRAETSPVDQTQCGGRDTPGVGACRYMRTKRAQTLGNPGTT
jgi:hypothetical protein